MNIENIDDIAYKLDVEIEAKIEAILEEIENAVKNTVPTKYVKLILTSLEKTIGIEGINCFFSKKTSEKTSEKAVNQKVGKDKIQELIPELTEAVVEEVEDILKDVDEICNKIVNEIIDEDINKTELEEYLKFKIESLMAGKGVNFKLSRNSFTKNEDIPSISVIKGKRRRIIILDELEVETVR